MCKPRVHTNPRASKTGNYDVGGLPTSQRLPIKIYHPIDVMEGWPVIIIPYVVIEMER